MCLGTFSRRARSIFYNLLRRLLRRTFAPQIYDNAWFSSSLQKETPSYSKDEVYTRVTTFIHKSLSASASSSTYILSCYNGQVPSQPTGCFVWCAAQRGIHDQLPLHLSPAGNSLSVSLIITCSYHSLILSKNIIGISYPIKNTASLTTCNQSGWRDSNTRPLRPERSALPSWATPRKWEFSLTTEICYHILFLLSTTKFHIAGFF